MDKIGTHKSSYGSYYKENPPARAAFGVVKLPLGVLIEIETIAVK